MSAIEFQAEVKDGHITIPEAYKDQFTGTVRVILMTPDAVTASSPTASNGKAMADALDKLAASGALTHISDPSAWQREQRQDRTLPDRDG